MPRAREGCPHAAPAVSLSVFFQIVKGECGSNCHACGLLALDCENIKAPKWEQCMFDL